MESSPLWPLQLNTSTGEPYLRLPTPHENIIITPPRTTDEPANMQNMNDLKIVKWLEGPPYPYLPHHATEWVSSIKKAADETLQELGHEPVAPREHHKLVGKCPVRVIREVQPDGTDVMVGDVDVHRCGYPDVQDSQERQRLTDENEQKPVGDPEVVWCIGDYVASAYHGRGIMSAALGTVMAKWMIPRMGVRLIRAEAFEGNIGSSRVFEKNGFVLEETVHFEKVTNSGEKITGMHILWWRS